MKSGTWPLTGFWAPAVAAMAVVVVYGVIACTAASELGSRSASDDYYNRLVAGLTKGQLSLDLAAPPGLASLSDPYDPRQNAPFQGQAFMPGRFHDLSYYHGKLYLYFSVVPAVVLFLPFHLLTGGYLSHQQACFVLSAVGFLASVLLLEGIRRRHFPSTGPVAMAVGVLGMGLGALVPIVLQRPDVWEVPIFGAYACWMVALGCLWLYLSGPAAAWAALAAASAAVGLAIGCRPNSFLGGTLLLWPLWRLTRPGRPKGYGPLLALVLPIGLIGLGLMAYNVGRFGDIFNFGQGYQLAGDIERIPHFLFDFFAYNFRLYFLEYPGWQRAFPYVRDLLPPPEPVGHVVVETPVALTQIPFVFGAAALPFWLRRQSPADCRPLIAILSAMLILVASGVGSLCLYFAACVRYQIEFVPVLMVLAAIGFLALSTMNRSRRWLRRGLIATASVAAVVSIGFNLLMAASQRGLADTKHGIAVLQAGALDQGADLFSAALKLRPQNVAARVGLSNIRAREGRFAEAGDELKAALAIAPNAAGLHLSYAYCLARTAQLSAAIAECDRALQLQPNFPEAESAGRQLRALQAQLPR